MVLSKLYRKTREVANSSNLTASKKRRLRREKSQAAHTAYQISVVNKDISIDLPTNNTSGPKKLDAKQVSDTSSQEEHSKLNKIKVHIEVEARILNADMSSKEVPSKSREDIKAAREAKKLAKQKAKTNANAILGEVKDDPAKELDKAQIEFEKETPTITAGQKVQVSSEVSSPSKPQSKSKDEVDRAIVVDKVKEKQSKEQAVVVDKVKEAEKSKEQVTTERAAKKAVKQTNQRPVDAVHDMTVKDVVETLKDIKNVAKEVQDITAKVSAIHFEAKKPEESGKSKAELKAERRAKQDAQRAAKQAVEQKTAKIKAEPAKSKAEPAKSKAEPPKSKAQLSAKPDGDVVKEKSPKPKTSEKSKPKSVGANRVNWFQHLYTEHDKETLKKIALNSNLHPAVIKLGVQLASRVVTGSNARCIGLLDAIKKMVRDYTLPAKTEFARGLESHLTASLDFLWAMRQPSASQTNAVKYFRHLLTQLPNNVDEFDAKKSLQEEIDKYIEDQIDKAGEAISMAVRNKISTGDNILTYGCSSLIERILREAWAAGLQFRAVLVGDRVHASARELLRRLARAGLPCTYVDITALSFVMKTINKVLLGADSLLVNGCVVGAAGTAQVALAARACNVPVLVACETHKVSGRVQTDAFVYNEIGDPDELIDKSDENSPLKDWRSNPNLTPLNLTYDVTPPSLVTAVVTETAILPCTSAPVVLRTKLSEYGI